MNAMPEKPPETLSVLVVEDSAALGELVQELLADAGHTVHLAASSNEAAVLINSDIKLDLIFTDIVLPGGQNGFELVEEARRIHDDIRALFMTGHSGHRISGAIEASGGVLLTKPFRRIDMNEAIARVMA